MKALIPIVVLAMVISGCSDRYDEGYDEGRGAGYTLGHDIGYDAGYLVGYDEGYAESKPMITIAPIPRQSTDITIQDLFVYKNLLLEEDLEGFSLRFSGEISNGTGADFSLAEFEIILYDQRQATIDTDRMLIVDFRDGDTRFFDELILTPIEEVHFYSITFIEG